MVKMRRELGFDQRSDEDDDDIRVERTARPTMRRRPERGDFERPSSERPSSERPSSERRPPERRTPEPVDTVKLRGVGMPRPQRTAREVQDELAREQLRRNLLGAFGLVLVAFSSAMDVALASWSVNDPSWNHLTQGTVHNFLGASGATIADLIMQFIGLASVVLFLPVAVWGLRLMVGRPIALARARVASWAVGTLITAGFLDTLPVIQSWPLPTGLGGVVGDRILRLPVYFSGGALGGLSWWVVFITLGSFAVVLLTFSAGVPLAWPFGAPREADDAGDEEQSDDDERFTWWDYLQGAVAHTRMSMLARRRRREPVLAAGGDYREPTGNDDEPAYPRRSRPMAETHAYEAPTREWAPEYNDEHNDETDPEPDHAEDDDETSFDARNNEGYEGGYDEPPAVESRPHPRIDLPAFADRLFTRGPAARMGHRGDDRRGHIDPVDPRFEATDEPGDDEPPIARPHPSRPAPSARPVRVDAIARPVPGKRDIRERQGRLIEESGAFLLPPVHLLAEPKPGQQMKISNDALEQNAHDLERVLDEFGVRGEIINVRPGPVVTLYELEPAPGIKSSRVIGLAEDIARSMSAVAARVAVIPGKNAIGIELPNAKRETVFLRELIGAQDFERTKARLAICLGKTIGGEPVIVDLTRMPHVLVAGTTGSGKSVSINTMILSLLYRLSPRDCRLIMIDPKMLELSVYDGIPHLLTPVVTDPKKAVVALKWSVREMEERYRKMSKLGVRNIDGFNSRVAESATRGEKISRTVQTGFDRHSGEPIYETEDMDLSPLPYIVVIIDEMADLMMVAGKEIEGAVQRLAQMARAAGIHVIMATQRPSVDVITGTIKANFPTRISFQVTSKIDSRTILGEQGAEQLLGQGDMLYMAGGGRIQRVHGPFVSDGEVEDIVAHLKAQGSPDYVDSVTEEDGGDEEGEDGEKDGSSSGEGGDLYDQAIAIVLRDKRPTTSYIQRRLGVGYNKAASMIEQMEKDGLISPPKAGGKRDILVRQRDDDEF